MFSGVTSGEASLLTNYADNAIIKSSLPPTTEISLDRNGPMTKKLMEPTMMNNKFAASDKAHFISTMPFISTAKVNR